MAKLINKCDLFLLCFHTKQLWSWEETQTWHAYHWHFLLLTSPAFYHACQYPFIHIKAKWLSLRFNISAVCGSRINNSISSLKKWGAEAQRWCHQHKEKSSSTEKRRQLDYVSNKRVSFLGLLILMCFIFMITVLSQ